MAKEKYENLVLPRLKEIEQWIKDGYFEKDIIVLLGVSKTSWEKYKNEHCELSELIKKSKQEIFRELEPVAVKSLKRLIEGFHEYDYERITKISKKGTTETTERAIKKYYKPDPTMIIYALKVIDKRWNDNKAMIDLKTQHIELLREKLDKEF